MKLRLIAVAATLGVGLASGSSSIAIAQEKAQDKTAAPAPAKEEAVNAEIIILHATNDGTGIDPKLGKMPELGKPPFSAYNSYKLLDTSKQPVTKGNSATVKLPNGRDLKISLKDIVLPKKKDDVKKFIVSASIQKATGDTFLPLLEVSAKAGETFFVAGQKHKDGILVIGIKVLP